MSDDTTRRGRVDISAHLLLELMGFNPKTHHVSMAEFDGRAGGIISLWIVGPDMPETPIGEEPPVMLPVFRKRDWDRVELRVLS